MQEKIRKIIPYILIGTATVVAILIYLLAANKRKEYSLYLFDRTFTKETVCLPIESKPKSPINHYVSVEQETGVQNAVSFVALDSVHAFVAMVKSDSIPQSSGLYRYDPLHRKAYSDSCLCQFNLPDNYENALQRLLAYDAKISRIPDGFVLSFLHFSDVFVFDSHGKMKHHLRTKDNVPPPSIIKYQDYYLYERGKAFNTNKAAFVHKNKFYAFSLKTSSHLTQFLLDCYDINNNEYLYSFYIDNVSREENLYIENVAVKGDSVTIESRNSTTIIKML